MSTKHLKRNLLTGSFLGISLCILGCGIVFILAKVFESRTSQAPIRSFIVTIEKGQHKELFEQLQSFAPNHSSTYNLTDYGGQGENFLVDIRGDNIKILANRTSSDLTKFDISFFAPSPGDPAPDKEFVAGLALDLKTFLSELSIVVAVEEK